MNNNFDVRQKISSFIAIIFILSLSLSLGWYTINTSEELLTNMPNSKTINPNKRMQNETSQEKTEMEDVLREGGIQSVKVEKTPASARAYSEE